MKTRSETFRTYLKEEYELRLTKHGKYPLRAYAQSLDIDVSSLHCIMNGKRAVGPKLFRRLGEKIGLGIEEIETIIASTSSS